YALAKEIGAKRAMCQALIPTTWFTDYWVDYRDQAIANNDEARALAEELGDEELQLDTASARFRLESIDEAHEEAMRIRRRRAAPYRGPGAPRVARPEERSDLLSRHDHGCRGGGARARRVHAGALPRRPIGRTRRATRHAARSHHRARAGNACPRWSRTLG